MPDYRITVEGSEAIPVRAANKQAAVTAAVRKKVTAELLTIDDAMAFGAAGVPMLVAGAEDEAAPAGDSDDKVDIKQ